MRVIGRQIRANVRSHRLQTLLILVTLTASAVLLTLAAISRTAAVDAWSALRDRTGRPDLWFQLDGRYVEADQAQQRLAGLTGVEEVNPVGRRIAVRALGAAGFFSELQVQEWATSTGVGSPLLVAGRGPRPGGDRPEVAVDRNFARVHGFDVGSVVRIPTVGRTVALEVVGLAVAPEQCAYPLCSPSRVYGAPGSLERIGFDPPPSPDAVRDVVALRLADPARTDEVARAAERVLPPGALARITGWEEVREVVAFSVSPQTIPLTAFGTVAALVAGILIANAVAGAVRSETRHIGLLKAVGFTGRQLGLVYFAEYLGLALAGGVIGTTVGTLVGRPLVAPLSRPYGMDAPPIHLAALAIAPLLAIVIAGVFVAWPLRRAVRIDTVTAIRAGAEAPRGRATSLSAFPVTLAQAIRDLVSRRGRTILSGLGLMVSVVGLIFVLATNAMIGSVLTDPDMSFYGDADVLAMRSGLVADSAVRPLLERAEVAEMMAEYQVEFSLPGEPERYFGRFLDGDVGSFRPPLLEGRMFRGDGEAVAGYGLAAERGLAVGDRVEVIVGGAPTSVTITGIVREFNNLGRMLTMPAATLHRAQPGTGANLYVIQLRPGVDEQAFADTVAGETGGLVGTTVLDADALPPTIRDMRRVLLSLSVVMSVLVAVGVLSSMALTVAERRREIGLLKAVGMTPRQVMASVLIGAALLALAAYIVGVPSGLALTDYLAGGIGESIGIGPISPPADPWALLLVLPVVLVVALLGAGLPARAASRVATLDVLRYE